MKDDEVYGEGNFYDYGFRMYDGRLGRWWAVDPLRKKFPSYSPFNYGLNNPVFYIDPDGRIIDISKLSKQDKETYRAAIKKLSTSELFRAYYEVLLNSETTYYIQNSQGVGGGEGSFNPRTGEVNSNINNGLVLGQELFHAFQSDLGVYNKEDASVRETEGDIITGNLMFTVDFGKKGDDDGLPFMTQSDWDQRINLDYTDHKGIFDERVFSDDFNRIFNKAVESRIKFYKNREKVQGAAAPKGYVMPNSGVGAKALKVAVKKMIENRALIGPRNKEGYFYPKTEQE